MAAPNARTFALHHNIRRRYLAQRIKAQPFFLSFLLSLEQQNDEPMIKFHTALFLLSAVASGAFSQASTYGNFKLDEQELIYQKIFTQDSITLEKLSEYFGKHSFVGNLNVDDTRLAFDLNEFVVDYKKFGFSPVSTFTLLKTGKFYGTVTISVRDGKYRVTVRNIEFTGDLGSKTVTTREPLTKYACRDNGMYISSDWTKPNSLALLDKALTDKFQYVESKKKKDEGDF
jgi:hypothetical protein